MANYYWLLSTLPTQWPVNLQAFHLVCYLQTFWVIISPASRSFLMRLHWPVLSWMCSTNLWSLSSLFLSLPPSPCPLPSLVLYPDNSSCFGLSAQFIQFRTSVGSLLGSPFLYKSLENSLLSLSFLMWEKSKYLEPVSRVVFEEWCIFIHKCKFHFPYIVLYIIYTFLKINFEKWQFTHQSWVVHPWEAHFSHSLFHGFRILQHPLTSCACPRLVSSTLSSFLQYTCNPKGIFASRLY